MKAITAEISHSIYPAQDDEQFEGSPLRCGQHYWQLGLLGVALLQLRLPARAFPTSVVARWNDQTIQSIHDARAEPLRAAHILAIVPTCGYDAWSAYDSIAMGTQLGARLRRPPAERSAANRAQAFSYGAYHALLHLFPQSAQQTRIRHFMGSLGYDPDERSTETTTPAGIGSVAAAAVLKFALGTSSERRLSKPDQEFSKSPARHS